MLDDVHDEGEETLTLALANPSSGRLTDAEATGTIKNRDPLPRALLARFGRTAAVHIVEQVEGTGGGAARAGVPGPVRGPGAAAGERIRPVAPSLPRLAVVLRIWAVFGECEACNLLIIKDRVSPETNVVP